ncbi:DUF6328 family protein [Streptomyces sp. MST-110588]|uniref:DUF6328 family protein n=1 Tax=Streptomyces sp. MST-110588 TaxID=2833628 RepID=UPI001F5DB187|nr:DUF6328 family protein [Streptomyces sp. MST-110588]
MDRPTDRPGTPDPGAGGREERQEDAQERHETALERYDRNFSELLQELRVMQTGVQILFAFLLTLAFTPRFVSLDTVQRATYVGTLLLAVLAAVLLTAPVATHRMLFQRREKRLVVMVSARLAGAGMAAVAVALAGAVTLVVDVVLNRAAGVAAGAATLLACAALWAFLPRVLGRRNGHDHERAGPGPGAADRAGDQDGYGGDTRSTRG